MGKPLSANDAFMMQAGFVGTFFFFLLVTTFRNLMFSVLHYISQIVWVQLRTCKWNILVIPCDCWRQTHLSSTGKRPQTPGSHFKVIFRQSGNRQTNIFSGVCVCVCFHVSFGLTSSFRPDWKWPVPYQHTQSQSHRTQFLLSAALEWRAYTANCPSVRSRSSQSPYIRSQPAVWTWWAGRK